ncbi:hypothetical protein L596_003681 [Steinernema carpocapsae]|uniref:Ig-like domain-containing protein n=1 Tax=Steinernema carpocapsae TaxID=34508 RepID=A0A4U8UXD1_STECR|nr:hypothetical protein L596_003681 [Steinernema carpocapsae]
MNAVRVLIVVTVTLKCTCDPLKAQYAVQLQYGKADAGKEHTILAKPGSKFLINCQLEGNWPKGAKVEWAKDGSALKKVTNMKILSPQLISFDSFDEGKHGGIYECLARSKDMVSHKVFEQKDEKIFKRSTQRIIVRRDGSSQIHFPDNVQFCQKSGYCLNGGICLHDASNQQLCICMNNYRGERCQVPPLAKMGWEAEITRKEGAVPVGILTWRDLLILVLILTVFCLVFCILLTGALLFCRRPYFRQTSDKLPLCQCCEMYVPHYWSHRRHIEYEMPPCDSRRSLHAGNSRASLEEQEKGELRYSQVPTECVNDVEANSSSSSCMEASHEDKHAIEQRDFFDDSEKDKLHISLSTNDKRPSRSRLVVQKNVDHSDVYSGTVKHNRLAPGLQHLASTDCKFFRPIAQRS